MTISFQGKWSSTFWAKAFGRAAYCSYFCSPESTSYLNQIQLFSTTDKLVLYSQAELRIGMELPFTLKKWNFQMAHRDISHLSSQHSLWCKFSTWFVAERYMMNSMSLPESKPTSHSSGFSSWFSGVKLWSHSLVIKFSSATRMGWTEYSGRSL